MIGGILKKCFIRSDALDIPHSLNLPPIILTLFRGRSQAFSICLISITYRIYFFDRVGLADGEYRETVVQEGLDLKLAKM